jgi:WD40 repeat protein
MPPRDDLIAEGGRSAQLFAGLVRSDQKWLELCRAAARGDTDAAKRLQDEDTSEKHALRAYGRPMPGQGDRLEEVPTSFEAAAAAAIGNFALAAAGMSDLAAAAAQLLAHCEVAGLVSVGMRSDLGHAVTPDRTHSASDAIALLLATSDSPARGFAEVLLGQLTDEGARRVPHVTVPVLFGGDPGPGGAEDKAAPGASGKLTIERRASGPSGLHPNPASMSFLQTDSAMVEAIRNAWAASRMVGSHTCLLWSLRLDTPSSDPVDSVGGGSLGGAFAVALDELASGTGRLRSFANRFTLDPHTAVSAAVDDTGRLHEVKGLSDKIAAAHRAGLNVVVSTECGDKARKAVTSGLEVRIEQATDVRDAVRLTRTHANPRFRWTLVASTALVAVIAVAGYAVLEARQAARVESLASRLATQAITLANSDPRRAALFALTSNELNANDQTREAMSIVAQNNLNALASRQVTPEPVQQIAASATTVLASDETTSISVLSLPNLDLIGKIQVDSSRPQIASGGPYEDEFAVIDGNQLELYAGAEGKLPVLVETVALPFSVDVGTFGPYVDSRGGWLVLSESLQGAYWSPATREAITFDLRDDSWLQDNSADLVRVTAASGFGPPGEIQGEPTNGAPGDRFVITTNLGQALELHLEESAPDDPWRENPVPVWIEPHYGAAIGRGTGVLSLGWAQEELLVGTDVGIRSWDLNSSQETAFPYGGVTERIEHIVSSDVPAAVTPSGVTLLTPTRSSPLNDTTVAAATRYPVESLAPAGNAWVAGRFNGVVMVIDSGDRPFITTSASVQEISSDGTLLLSSGTQQQATGIDRYAVDSAANGPIARYWIGDALPESPYLNAAAGDGQVVVAGGLTRGKKGVVLAWQSPDDEPRVLDFAADPSKNIELDMVASVVYDAEAGVVGAYKPGEGVLALWSTDTWERTLINFRQPGGTQEGANVISASADGSLVSVSDSNRVTVVRTATGETVSAFPAVESRAVLSPDGTRMALFTKTKVSIVGLDGRELGGFVPDGSIGGAAWSPDGSVLALSSWETGSVTFLDTATFTTRGLPWRSPSGHVPVNLLWTADGAALLLSTGEWVSGFFEVKGIDRLEPGKTTWDRRLCALAPTPLTHDEWDEAGGGTVKMPTVCR